MVQPIVYIDTSKIREGKLEELEVAMDHLATFVGENVPQLISYAFFLNENRTQMTVVAVHPNSASLAYHLDVGADEFKKFSHLINLLGIEVYGRISDAVLERLRQKSSALGSGKVTLHEFYAGFSR